MVDAELSDDNWALVSSSQSDIEEMMSWFKTGDDINIWGGPTFRFPFTRDSFFHDLYWGRMASFSLRNADDKLAAFGQLYERFACINLARLVVNPDMRGHGVGKKLVQALMDEAPARFGKDRFSLFVYRENTPAYECYKAMGFVVTPYPAGVEHADVCYYLTRPLPNETEV